MIYLVCGASWTATKNLWIVLLGWVLRCFSKRLGVSLLKRSRNHYFELCSVLDSFVVSSGTRSVSEYVVVNSLLWLLWFNKKLRFVLIERWCPWRSTYSVLWNCPRVVANCLIAYWYEKFNFKSSRNFILSFSVSRGENRSSTDWLSDIISVTEMYSNQCCLAMVLMFQAPAWVQETP